MIRRLALLLLTAGLAGSWIGCPRDEPSPRGRVLLVGIDGASPRLCEAWIAEGRLPNLAALARDGVSGRIRSMLPLSSPRIWNTIATGKTPEKHGITHFAIRHADAPPELYLSHHRRVHALWNIASDAGLEVGVVNFWNTYPPERIRGVMVSDHWLARSVDERRQLTGATSVAGGPVVHPEAWQARLDALLARRAPVTDFENPLLPPAELPAYLVLVGDDLPRRFDEDGALVRVAREIDSAIHPDLMMVLLPGIDRVSHFLWGSLEDPSAYRAELRVSDAERAGGRAALRRYYEYTDALLGVLLQGYGPDDLVIALSDHGFEAGEGFGLLTGVHESEAALDGIFFARGRDVPRGGDAGELSVRDVTPTILRWLGMPVAADMDGRPAGFLATRTLDPIASYDTTPIERAGSGASGGEHEIVDQLRSLGYLE